MEIQRLYAQSGISKAYDEDNANQSLEAISNVMESIESSFWELFFKVSGKENTEYTVIYNHNFDVIDKGAKLERLIDAKDTISNEKIKLTIDKIILKTQLNTDLDREELSEIVDIIDEDINNYEEKPEMEEPETMQSISIEDIEETEVL